MIGDIHHFGLTVRDVDASTAWYVDVLGFQRVGEFKLADGARHKVFLRHDGLRARLGLTQHVCGSQDLFDETRVGLDHLAFIVTERAELDVWATKLPGIGVVHSSVAPANSFQAHSFLFFATRTIFSSSCSLIHRFLERASQSEECRTATSFPLARHHRGEEGDAAGADVGLEQVCMRRRGPSPLSILNDFLRAHWTDRYVDRAG
jgi:glyoxylase I family protein